MKRIKHACLALSSMMAGACSEVGDARMDITQAARTSIAVDAGRQPRSPALTVDSNIGELLDHSAFAGHNHLLLPWDRREYDRSMPLSGIASLLPYHSEVRPRDVVAGLNRMIADVNKGQRVFYDFYTPAQKQADPGKADTGLFFFRGKPGAPFAVIAPGGGFAYVGSVHEGFPYAAEISRLGYNAFVLKYRVGSGSTPATEDLAAAVSWLREHAATLGIAPDGYSLWGSSAGARMAAYIGSHGLERFGGSSGPKPSAVIMAYTGHADHAETEPPTFIAVGEHDGIAPPAAMERRAAELRKRGTKVAYRRFRDVGHGFGLGTGTSAEGWIGDAVRFWEAARAGAPR